MASVTEIEAEPAAVPGKTSPEALPLVSTLFRGVSLLRFTVDQYLQIGEKQILPDDDRRFELLDGMIVEKMTTGIPHDYAVMRLRDLFAAVLPVDCSIRQDISLSLREYWLPEPDIAIVFGTTQDYRRRRATSRDVALVIEVSDSTYLKDRGIKWTGSASAGLPIYWIARLETSTVEVYSDPKGEGEAAHYQSMTSYKAGESVPVRIGGREIGVIPVEEIMD